MGPKGFNNGEHDTGEYEIGHHHPRRRRGDATITRFGKLAGSVLALIALILLVLNAFGWRRYNPEAEIQRSAAKEEAALVIIRAGMDSLRRAQAQLRLDHEPLEEGMTVLIRDACMDPMKSTRDKKLVGLLDKNGYCIR